MNYILRYQSSRAEIWRWYWRGWRSRFWQWHVLIAAAIALPLADSLAGPINARSYLVCFLGAFPLVVLLFSAWPQLRFKQQERTLQVGPEGWSTQIGGQSGSRPWSGVASVYEANGSVVISSTTGNALIVPLQAFATPALMHQFVKDAQAWHRGHAV